MHYVKKLPPIALVSLFTGESLKNPDGSLVVITHEGRYAGVLFADKRIATTHVHLAELLDLVKGFRATEENDYWAVEDEPWRRMKTILDGLPEEHRNAPMIDAQLEPFSLALTEAATKRPAAKLPPETEPPSPGAREAKRTKALANGLGKTPLKNGEKDEAANG